MKSTSIIITFFFFSRTHSQGTSVRIMYPTIISRHIIMNYLQRFIMAPLLGHQEYYKNTRRVFVNDKFPSPERIWWYGPPVSSSFRLTSFLVTTGHQASCGDFISLVKLFSHIPLKRNKSAVRIAGGRATMRAPIPVPP